MYLTNTVKYFHISNKQLALNDTDQEEDSVLIVWQAALFVDSVLKDELLEEFRKIKIKLPKKRITLLVCGLMEYNRTNGKAAAACELLKLQVHLTKLQLFANINHRLLDTSADLANTVMQFTKSVAEAPYKYVLNLYCITVTTLCLQLI